MDKQTVTDKLWNIIQPYVEEGYHVESVKEDTHLLDDLNINSIHLVDIILDVEEAFDIEIDDEEAERMMTVKAGVDIILSKLG